MKRYVFSNFLKSVRLSQLLTWLGSWFHHFGPITLKALNANVFNFVSRFQQSFYHIVTAKSLLSIFRKSY